MRARCIRCNPRFVDAAGWSRTAFLARPALLTLVVVAIGTVAPVRAQSEGPNAPATVVSDPSFGTAAWLNPEDAAISDDTYALGLSDRTL
jgi:hypothetical protein